MGKFEVGNSGGPGRPKQKPFLEWCGKWTKERAEEFLRPIAQDPKNKFQMEAIKLIMAYGVGKPVEYAEASHSFQADIVNPDDALDILGSLVPKSKTGSNGSCPIPDAVKAAEPLKISCPERGTEDSNTGGG